MIQVRRLLAVGAILAGAAILTSTDVWGEPGRDKELNDWRKGDGKAVKPARDEGHFAADLDRNRFTDAPVGAYKDGADTLFWLQVRPTLPDAPALPKDYLVLIDTNASKAAGPLAVSVRIAHGQRAKLGETARMA